MANTTLSYPREEEKPLPCSTDEEEEEDDDLFEIDIDIQDKFPQRKCFSSVPASRNVLLANCLLPVADVSIAVPSSLSPLMLVKGDDVQRTMVLRGLKGLFRSSNTHHRTGVADAMPSGFRSDRLSGPQHPRDHF